jgi:hypothetical protein
MSYLNNDVAFFHCHIILNAFLHFIGFPMYIKQIGALMLTFETILDAFNSMLLLRMEIENQKIRFCTW